MATRPRRFKANSCDLPSTIEMNPVDHPQRRRGGKPCPVVEFPTVIEADWTDPDSFEDALKLHMKRHGDTCWHLHKAITLEGERFDRSTIKMWVRGTKVPRSLVSLTMLARIERRYRLPKGYFTAKFPNKARAAIGHNIAGVSPAERRRLAWHLPDDFDSRPAAERTAILEWVRTVVISGATDYRRYQAQAIKTRYAVRFPALVGRKARRDLHSDEIGSDELSRSDLRVGTVDAPPLLAAEMASLIKFKTATLTAIGFQRSGVWGEETSFQKIEHLGLLFGALAASPNGEIKGRGIDLKSLTFALLVFPQVWDWYVQWRERRRGFYTQWEVEMLALGLALMRAGTGWLRQNPSLADRLKPIDGLITTEEIAAVKADWNAACDAYYVHGLARSKEIERVARVHREPFEPILPVLEADSPVGEYRKIANEIVRLMPDDRRYPRAAAESIRSLLMLRLGLHLGLRQKNLRQLMLCLPGQPPRSERQLESLKRGELRWSERAQGWEVMVPAVAFKNADSSFFSGNPFRLLLPNLDGLYDRIESYIRRHRVSLLNGADDPGTFFIKTVKTSSQNAAYDRNTFYEAWRLIIQRYGVYNPFTGRGVIEGLLPHGPHNVRDVLATHILKQTGSYEQASYAIQDTPDMVAKHYGRFLPQDKAALAAEILNRVWSG